MTIFDTDFQPDDRVILYDDSEGYWRGRVDEMTEADKRYFNASDFFLLDKSEGYKALFIR